MNKKITPDAIEASTAHQSFKKKNSAGVGESFEFNNDAGRQIIIEPMRGNFLRIDFREVGKTDAGGRSNKRQLQWRMDAQSAIQAASILIFIAESQLANSDEVPHLHIVTDAEKVGFGINWVREEMNTSIERMERRKSRSHLLGLFRRCMEVSEDEDLIAVLMMNLEAWAERSGDPFAMQKAELAANQLGFKHHNPTH